jgi:(2S)-methylsuccinyl-CoA dehydrogenase
MTVLARTVPDTDRLQAACRCSWPKRHAALTPTRSRTRGISGGEIEVLGYRGMKEYTSPSTTSA